jgi:hypothetical protein
VFYSSGNPLRMDGHGGATFRAQGLGPPTGFRSDGKGTCRFMGAQAVGEECLTPEGEPEVAPSNFVY